MVTSWIYHGRTGVVLLALGACAQAPAASAEIVSQAKPAHVAQTAPAVSTSMAVPTTSATAGTAVGTATAMSQAFSSLTSPLAEFAAAWSSADEDPMEYGVRFLRTDGDQISEDIRYAIRPWETQGQTFLSGYGAE